MIAQAIATVLMLIVFMFGFTYFLNSLFFRRIEKHDHEQTKKREHQDHHSSECSRQYVLC